MENSVLIPPNSQHFSDGVIGDVQQRIKSVARSSDAWGNPFDNFASNSAEGVHRLPPSVLEALERHFLPVREGKKQSIIATSGEPQPNTEAPDERAAIVELVMLGKQSLKKRHHDSQRRYRQRQKDWRISLENDTHQLREEINRLKLRCRDFTATTSIWEVTIEYFRIFRYGLSRRWQYTEASDFLLRAMAPDVVFNAAQGPEAILKNWDNFRWFADVEVELDGLQMSVGGSLVATTTTVLTITEQTMQNIFPGVCIRDPDKPELMPPLAIKLLDQRIAFRGWTRFEWVSNRVTCLTSQADLLTPILNLVGSLGLLSQVFETSLVTPDFQWSPP